MQEGGGLRWSVTHLIHADEPPWPSHPPTCPPTAQLRGQERLKRWAWQLRAYRDQKEWVSPACLPPEPGSPPAALLLRFKWSVQLEEAKSDPRTLHRGCSGHFATSRVHLMFGYNGLKRAINSFLQFNSNTELLYGLFVWRWLWHLAQSIHATSFHSGHY